jgi:hypothetical protein
MCLLSRDTVKKAYKTLRNRNKKVSDKRKSLLHNTHREVDKVNIFFLVNKASTYKMLIYDSFVNAIVVSALAPMFSSSLCSRVVPGIGAIHVFLGQ